MSVLLEVRLPFSTLTALRNAEDIEACLEGLLVDYNGSLTATSINDITKAVLASVKALPCEVIPKDDAVEAPSDTGIRAPSPIAWGLATPTRSPAYSVNRLSHVGAYEDDTIRSPHDFSNSQGLVGSVVSNDDDGTSACKCWLVTDHFPLQLIIRDAMLRSKRFCVKNCSTLRELALQWAAAFNTPSDPHEYSWSTYVEGRFHGFVPCDEFDRPLSMIVKDETTFVLSPAFDINITVRDANDLARYYHLRDTLPFHYFQTLWVKDAGIGKDTVRFQFDGKAINISSSAQKSLKELGFYDNVEVLATLPSQSHSHQVLIHVQDSNRVKCSLFLKRSDTVGDLLRAYTFEVDNAPAKISFSYAGKILTGITDPLHSFGITYGANVTVIRDAETDAEQLRIVFLDAMNHECTHFFSALDTYLTLLDRYANDVGLPVDSLVLTFNGVVLGEERMKGVLELGLYDDAVIHVTSKSPQLQWKGTAHSTNSSLQ